MSRSTTATSVDSARRADLVGVVVVGLLIIVSCFEAFHLLHRHPYPAEDAAMLMRYARNFAAGHGIRFNVGQHPVDGATDFGSMVMVAAGIKLGLSPSSSVVALDVIAQVVTIAVVYVTGRRVVGASVGVCVVAAAAVALGPGMFYTQARFATPVFACGVALTWAFAMCAERQPSDSALRRFAIAGLVTGLIRPEGVILFILAALALTLRLDRERRPALGKAILIFFVPAGAVYFAFHWVYFGYPLPNPFYKKSGGVLHLGGLRDAVSFTAKWLGPIAILYALAARRQWRTVLFYAIPVVGFSMAWVLLSNETNYGRRFQYPLLVLVALGLPPLWEVVRRTYPEVPGMAIRAIGALGIVLLLALWAHGYKSAVAEAAPLQREGLFTVAVNLHRLSGVHTMAVTEAGLLPFYSGWTSLDLWGLNDVSIAHHGLTAADIDQADPDLVMIHWAPKSPLRGWVRMEDTAMSWVTSHAYVLVASYGVSDDVDRYYVKPGPDERSIGPLVQIAPYYKSGSLAPANVPVR